MSQNEYFQCTACGQMVQGFNASQDIQCCDQKNMIPVTVPLPARGHRPRRADGELSMSFTVRLTPRELSMLTARAELEGRSVGDYIRRQALAIVGPPMFTTETLVGELYRRGYTLLLGGPAVYDDTVQAAERELNKTREQMEREMFPARSAAKAAKEK